MRTLTLPTSPLTMQFNPSPLWQQSLHDTWLPFINSLILKYCRDTYDEDLKADFRQAMFIALATVDQTRIKGRGGAAVAAYCRMVCRNTLFKELKSITRGSMWTGRLRDVVVDGEQVKVLYPARLARLDVMIEDGFQVAEDGTVSLESDEHEPGRPVLPRYMDGEEPIIL